MHRFSRLLVPAAKRYFAPRTLLPLGALLGGVCAFTSCESSPNAAGSTSKLPIAPSAPVQSPRDERIEKVIENTLPSVVQILIRLPAHHTYLTEYVDDRSPVRNGRWNSPFLQFPLLS